jgi:hypothetical protein
MWDGGLIRDDTVRDLHSSRRIQVLEAWTGGPGLVDGR